VYGLERSPRFDVRYDIPSECARLLHAEAIDVGLIPSIEYLRGGPYRIVPDLAIASNGAVRSVAIFTTRPMADVRSIAMDTSSRTSVALTRILCARMFRIEPRFEPHGPDLADMLDRCDAALIIGDNALFIDVESAGLKEVRLKEVRLKPDATRDAVDAVGMRSKAISGIRLQPDIGDMIEKIDLGEAWTKLTGLPFVYAFWAGRPAALMADDVEALQRARDEGVRRPEELARAYVGESPERQAIGARYLRDNIKYYLGQDEQAGLETFFRYAAEAGVVDRTAVPQFY
jgi:chorismate dehydratase